MAMRVALLTSWAGLVAYTAMFICRARVATLCTLSGNWEPKMINDNDIIDTLEELEAFLRSVESGKLGLDNAAGIALATNNADGRPFIAVLDDNHQLLLGRWVTQEVYDNGKDLVRNAPQQRH